MKYFISDMHFGHGNLNQSMDCRGFESVEAMNAYMIEKWNSRVKKKDEVYILGDFSISTDGAEVNDILRLLNGKKHLILGNHDRFVNKKTFDKSLLVSITHYMELHDNNRKIILSHYPIMCYNGQYRKSKNDDPSTYMLYGHVHNTFDEKIVNDYQNRVRQYKREINGSEEMINIPCQMINCFCMFSDYIPLTLDEWIEVDKKRRMEMELLTN